MKNGYKILYSNQEIINQRRISIFLTLILFLMSVILIATPNVLGRLLESQDAIMQRYPKSEAAMMFVLNNHNCQFDETLKCDFNDEKVQQIGEYWVAVNSKGGRDLSEFKGNYLVFADTGLIISYQGQELRGDYSLLQGSSFSKLLQQQKTEKLDDRQATGQLLQNISHAFLQQNMANIYFLILMQYIVYTVIIALIMKFINIPQAQLHYSYKELWTMSVLAMFAPAMVLAIFGLYNPVMAAAFFPIVYMIRIMLLYYKMMKQQINYKVLN